MSALTTPAQVERGLYNGLEQLLQVGLFISADGHASLLEGHNQRFNLRCRNGPRPYSVSQLVERDGARWSLAQPRPDEVVQFAHYIVHDSPFRVCCVAT